MSDTMTSRAKPPHPRRYRGGCPCGAVLWEVLLDLADNDQASDSVWQRSVPSPRFRLLRGNEGLSGYQFFANSAHHFFCARCSAHAYSHQVAAQPTSHEPGEQAGADVYTIDLRSLQVQRAPSSQDVGLGLTRQRPAAS
ncbi:MAG: hypothetical protein RLZZ450_1673 [Pseudomonadota bacterium]|jgi:hypothetical protein